MVNKPNIVLVAADGLRADHLGCYGYAHPTSPYLDSVAAAGALAEACFTPAIPAYASFGSLLSGQHPISHGIISDEMTDDFPDDIPLLPQSFLRAGYTTCSFDSLRHERSWFGRGCEYSINPGLRYAGRPQPVSAVELNSRAIPWIRSHVDEPLFLWIHYRDTCSDALLGMNQNGGSGDIQRQYDDCIRSLDNNIRELVTAVDDLRVSSRTLIVIVADRGQSLGEHGILCQSRGLYDCTLRVPLILRWPERITAGVRLPQMLQTHDLAAALVEAAGLPSRSTMEQEHSFWKLLAQEPAAGRDKIFSVDSSGQTQWCLRTRNHKFIVSREPNGSEASSRELYDLTADPEEKHNLANDRPDVAASMQAELEEIARRLREKNEDPWSEVGVALTRGV